MDDFPMSPAVSKTCGVAMNRQHDQSGWTY